MDKTINLFDKTRICVLDMNDPRLRKFLIAKFQEYELQCNNGDFEFTQNNFIERLKENVDRK